MYWEVVSPDGTIADQVTPFRYQMIYYHRYYPYYYPYYGYGWHYYW